MTDSCPACQCTEAKRFFELRAMPVSIGIQWPSAEEALSCKTGDVQLALCSRCGLIWNCAFDAGRLEYSQQYDNSLDFSPVFQDYARRLAHRLIDTYDIRGKDVVELGCGKGHFLTLLCQEGGNRGVGFDPSYQGGHMESTASAQIIYIRDFYGEQYTQYAGDLICCRHVFEHIPEPSGFLSLVQRTIGDRISVVYFEVPNVRFILEHLSVWDIIYEHCNYFSRESLTAVFQQCGFAVVRLEETYGNQFLSLDARTTGSNKEVAGREMDLSNLQASVDRFADLVQARLQGWQQRLAQWRAEGRSAVIWGGGAKAVSFLNMLKIAEPIPFVVDINPRKQGRYLPGTGQRIVAPDLLKEIRPQTVVLMNPMYRREVETQLRALGVTADVLDV
jgi:SAM-dependent methyltransferase